MGKGRRSFLLSYLSLAMIIVGALVNALPSSASTPTRARIGHVVFDVSGSGDHGVRPNPVVPQKLPDRRQSRASLDGGADADSILATGAYGIGPVVTRSFFLFDGRSCGASALRLSHRPRDPPQAT